LSSTGTRLTGGPEGGNSFAFGSSASSSNNTILCLKLEKGVERVVVGVKEMAEYRPLGRPHVCELTNESDAETILVAHDPPPSIALLLCTLPGFITLSIKLSTRSQNEIPKESPSLTTTAAQTSDTSTSEHPNPSFSVPWNEPHYPGDGRGPDGDRRPPPPPPREGDGDHPGRGPGEYPKPRPGDGPGGGPPRFPGEGRRPEYPPPDQPKDSFECFDWTEGVDPSLDSEEIVWTVSHNLRLDAPLFIRSYFNKAHGSLRVSLDDQLEEGEAALRVTASGITGDDVRHTKVCVGQMRDHTSALQLKVSLGSCLVTNPTHQYNQPTKHVAEIGRYDISLSLPYHRFMYPGIGTHLPGFSHAFDDMSLVDFDFINLDGADAEISAISLSARMLTVHSMGGSIIGKFIATRRLDISGTST
ncbi:703_t:CDS:2, partial [Acaulospora colombiana]